MRTLDYDELSEIALSYRKKALPDLFTDRFGSSLPEAVNASHGMVVVASELDDSSERIIDYLAEAHALRINAVFFTTFKTSGGELLGRAWLKNPATIEDVGRRRAPWSGYFFVNVGEGPHRSWDDNRRYGYLGAGQGTIYAGPLKRLQVGNKVFAYMKGLGYVGYGEVQSEARMIRDFVPEGQTLPLTQLPLSAKHGTENCDDPNMSEWAVRIRWHKTFDRGEARTFKGVFANPNIVCKLRDPETVEFLRREFGVED